jgi:hypothetical protein
MPAAARGIETNRAAAGRLARRILAAAAAIIRLNFAAWFLAVFRALEPAPGRRRKP